MKPTDVQKGNKMPPKRMWKQSDLDVANVALMVLKPAGDILLFNKLCEQLLNRKRNTLAGQNWFELILPQDEQESVKHLFQRAMLDETTALRQLQDLDIIATSGSELICWNLTVLRDRHGEIEGALCVGRDVTEQREIEQTLQFQSEEQGALNAILRISLEDISLEQQLERVLDLLLSLPWLPLESKGGIFQVDDQGETLVLKVQRGLAPALLIDCARVPFGYCLCGRAAESQEIQYASCLDHRHDISYDGIKPHGHYNVPILSRRGVLGVIVLYLKHGHIRQDSEIEFLGSVANTLAGLIEHRLTQDALRTSRSKMVEAQRIAHLGGWEWDITDNEVKLSNEAERIMGKSSQIGTLTLEIFLEMIHPDDRATFQQAIDRAISQGTSFGLDYRIRRTDGSERTIHCQVEPISDSYGETIRLSGTIQNITERKQMEETLRQSATVFENTTEGVMITDARGRVVSVNRAFTEITGYGQDDVIGKSTSILKSGRHDKAFYRIMWGRIRETGSWQGEIWNRRKNGNVYPEWLNISVVKDNEGNTTNYVGVFSDISDMKASEQKLDHLAHHDPLTGLPNRLLLNARMEQSMARAHRSNDMLAVLFLDLDHFKNVNDTLGHPVGDQLLQEVAHRLTACVRKEDTVTRLGGDEFTIVLEELHDSRFAGKVALKIIDELAKIFLLKGHEVFVTCSIGISIFPNDGNDITTLLKNADSALYRAKDEGRNNYQYYTEELTTRAMERMVMETNLRHALERNELVVYYQPQVDLYSGRVIGMEALLRWRHPEIGLIPPDAFIPLAEETGLIIPIGEWVLRTACARLKSWIDDGLPELRVAVNLSSRQFNQKNLPETIADILRDTGLKPQCLELELTERIVMQDADNSVEMLDSLKKLGIQFSIDDFGTGYSSLSYLKRFPIDRIKIDKSFVDHITTDSEDASISQAIISMSHGMNLKTVAEGVETLEQQEFLRSHQCDEIQGFYFSRPLPEMEMEHLLRSGINTDTQLTKVEQEERVLLLVDDDENIIQALTRVLHMDGYQILCATTPHEALKILATNRVDVMISDQSMPEMSGIELLSKVRNLHPDTIRILLTAYSDPNMMVRAINESAVYKFISKPWSDAQLREDVREAFLSSQTLLS